MNCRQLRDLPEPIRSQIGKRIRHLGEGPFPPGFRKLQHPEGLYRIRVGHYRVVYSVDRWARIIRIIRVRHRRDAYRGL